MNDLNFLYHQSKETFLMAIPQYWPEMHLLCDNFVDNRFLPEIITPAACCKTVGGEMEDTKEIGATILAAEISIRLLDDLTDQDKPNALYNKIGIPRTLNYIDAFRAVAYKILSDKCQEDKRYLEIMRKFTDCYLIVLAGQDRDLRQQNISWEEAWRTIEMKTGYIYATTAAMGAMAGTDNEKWIEACEKYGYHLGMAIQIFNDMDGIWSPEGIPDLEQGKITLPLLYALQCEHEAKQELQEVVIQNSVTHNSKRIKEILDEVDAKSYLIWAALKQRESGLEAISILPDNEGRQILEAHFTGMFGDIDELIATDNKPGTSMEQGFENLHKNIDPDMLDANQLNTSTSSKALNMRRKLRMHFT